jgi:hypothetical protein
MEFMPQQLAISLLIESTLIVVTTLLLAQPASFFPSASPRLRAVATYGGMLLLCVTFMWSVVLGMLFTLNPISTGL